MLAGLFKKDAVEILFIKGSLVRLLRDYRRTYLNPAQIQMIKSWLEGGADPDERAEPDDFMDTDTPLTSTALHYACMGAQLKASTALLDFGANPNLFNFAGDRALTYACNCLDPKPHVGGTKKKKAAKLIKKLLAPNKNNSIEVNVFNKEGYTPLAIAAEHENLGVVKLLIERGASQLVYENRHHTPMDIINGKLGMLGIPKHIKEACEKIKTILQGGLEAENHHKAYLVQRAKEKAWAADKEDRKKRQADEKERTRPRYTCIGTVVRNTKRATLTKFTCSSREIVSLTFLTRTFLQDE
jgi:ankyrin repeat protein